MQSLIEADIHSNYAVMNSYLDGPTLFGLILHVLPANISSISNQLNRVTITLKRCMIEIVQ